MNIDDFFDLLLYAKEQEEEEKIYQRWLLHYQSNIGYKEFKEELTKKSYTKIKKTDEEIIKDVDFILKKPKRK